MVTMGRLSTLALSVALASALGALGGCELLSEDALALEDGDGNVVTEAPVSGDSVASPGCPMTEVVSSDGLVCATCDFVDAPICGAPSTAVCESRQDSAGRPCELCLTDDGLVLYDDCRQDAAEGLEAARCETVPGATEFEVCSACFDEAGNVVSRTCSPSAERCESVVVDDGRTCSRCTTSRGESFSVCDAVDIDPDFCVVYGDAAGRCIDCYDAERSLLSHACTPVAGERVCEERVQPEGLVCKVCYDGGGFVVEQTCESRVPQLDRCETLVFSEQTCTVCVDATNSPTFVECRSTLCDDVRLTSSCRVDDDCAAGQVCYDGACAARDPSAPPIDPQEGDDVCAEPPACTMSRTSAGGTLCRTCPTSAGEEETRCLGVDVLACEVLQESELPEEVSSSTEDDVGNQGAAEPQGRLCVLCRDRSRGTEVYRDCDGNGAVPPPSCSEVIQADGSVCTACFDAVSRDPVFTSCGEARCHDRAERPLQSAAGLPIRLGDGAAAVATCEQCLVDDVDQVTCRLTPSCADDELFAAGASCPGTATLTIRPRRCENPWDAYRPGRERDDDLVGLLGFALAEHQLTLRAATTTPGPAACTEGCDCARGDRIELSFAEADAEAARVVFGSFLSP
jgi:hypothetical protein